jgi:hypothetical protein
MPKQAAARKQGQELTTVQLANAIRTSAGDYAPPGIVELPALEARALIASGHATRVEVAG